MQNEPILLYPNQVQKLLGIGTTKFYELVKLHDFPKPRSLSDGRGELWQLKNIRAIWLKEKNHLK